MNCPFICFFVGEKLTSEPIFALSAPRRSRQANINLLKLRRSGKLMRRCHS